MFRLETLGGLALTCGQIERPQPRRRLALFARLALPGDYGVGREELLALLWPERDTESARHSLDQLLYEARRALDGAPTIGTSSLQLNSHVVISDVAEFRTALDAGDFLSATRVYRGPFLHTFYLREAPEFERWVEQQRALLAAENRRALEALAGRATREGRPTEAVDWWRQIVAEDRFSSRAAVGLMRALADAGDSAGALEFARVHERIVRTELESAPDASVMDLANALRAKPIRTSRKELATQELAGGPSTKRWAWTPRRALTLVGTMILVVGAAYYAARSARQVHTVTSAPVATLGARPRERHRAGATSGTTNIEAHDLYERGKDPVLFRTDSGVRTAIEYLAQATALDSNYAAAYATLANRCATAAVANDLPVADRRAMYERATAAAHRAVALDDSLADAHAQLGYTLMIGYQLTAAETELKRAIALDLRAMDAREFLIKVYEWTNRSGAAVDEARRALSLDPLSPTLNAELGYALYFAGQNTDAIAQLEKVASIKPPLRRVADYRATALASHGEWQRAIAVLRPIPRQPRYQALLAGVLARSGSRAEATEILNEMLDAESRGLARGGEIVDIYAALGDYDRAFAWVDRAVDEYSLWPEIMGPIHDDLHRDRRFQRVERRLGLTVSEASPERERATSSR